MRSHAERGNDIHQYGGTGRQIEGILPLLPIKKREVLTLLTNISTIEPSEPAGSNANQRAAITMIVALNDAKAKMIGKIINGAPEGCTGRKETLPLRPHAAKAAVGNDRGAPRTPTQEELLYLQQQSARLETATPEEIIAWAVGEYFPKLTMATAFGPEGCVILSILAKIEPRVYVFNLDTGYQFPQTLELRDRIARRYGIQVELQRPELSVEQYERLHGGAVYERDSDKCCFDRKITVLYRAVKGYAAWMSGIRRDQSPHRAKAPIVGWDQKFGLVKISPLANWTNNDVWKRILDEKIPYNPLHDQGYPSIGCWPCTRSVLSGEDERAGRWSGTSKKECGLHTIGTVDGSNSGGSHENLRQD